MITRGKFLPIDSNSFAFVFTKVKIPLPSYLFLRTSEQKGTKENKGRVL